MRILLAHNSLYYPAHGGGDKSNRLLLEALAARGHDVRAVARIERFGEEPHRRYVEALRSRSVAFEIAAPEVRLRLNGVDVRTLTLDPHWRTFFAGHVEAFDPDVILASTDDPAQLLLDIALRAPRARVVYLVRATIAAPFGPDSSSPSERRAAALRKCDGVVGVSEYVAAYMRRWGGLDAVHLPISLMEPGEYLNLAAFENPLVTMVNPCAVKGISIFLALADCMPAVRFAAVPTWGTNAADRAELRRRQNVEMLAPVDDIDELLRKTRLLLVPSLWAEARSRIVVEAMARGVPVIASDVGGIPEAKLGVPYLLPVNPIARYRPAVDENMAPVAEVPEQAIEPWRATLARLLSDREHWEQVSRASRVAALEYVRHLNVAPFEQFLEKVAAAPKRFASEERIPTVLSADKQRLLAARLRQRAWLPYFELTLDRPRLFCFPYAGAGALAYQSWTAALGAAAQVCPVRLPGRESRRHEAPIRAMSTLVEALEDVIGPYLGQPFCFYGHSMGAAIAFELARALRRHGRPLPLALLVSGARAPQFRLDWSPPPEPDESEFIEQLRRLNGVPAEVLGNPEAMRLAMAALRADTALYRNYICTAEEPLPVPIFAYGGSVDPNVAIRDVAAWSEQTSARFVSRVFEGGHFFIHREDFRRELLKDLRSL